MENILEDANEKTIEKNPKNAIQLYIFLFIYLLIPIISVEGVICWSIGILGAYKTINIYRNNEENKNKKAIKLLIVSLIIAIIYNVLVYYATKVIISKVV